MRSASLFLMRWLVGLIFFWQGFGKVFEWTVDGVYENYFKSYEATFLPEWLIWTSAYYTSYVELICGFVLLIGLKRKSAYLLLSSVLIIVSFGHGLDSYIWDSTYVIHRALFLIPLMLLPGEWDRWSLDAYLMRRKTN